MEREPLLCLFFLVVALLCFECVFSYQQGAPTEACTKALYPKHGAPYSRASHSYVINVFKDDTRVKVDYYTPGQPLLVSISGGSLKGVLIMPVKNGNTGDFADGTWDFQSNSKRFHTVTCGNGKAGGMTHSDSNVKKDGEIIGRWTPSIYLRGRIKFQSTVVVTKEKFFIGIFTDFLSQKEPPPIPNVPETTIPTSENSHLTSLPPYVATSLTARVPTPKVTVKKETLQQNSHLTTLPSYVATSNKDELPLTARVQTPKVTVKKETSQQSGGENTQSTMPSFVTMSHQAPEITVRKKENAQGSSETTQTTMSSTPKSGMKSNRSSTLTVSFPVAIALSLLGLLAGIIRK